MRYDRDLHETRTNAEQSETSGDLRVSYESLRRIGNAVSRGEMRHALWADMPPIRDEPLYGACEVARAVLNPPLPWGALGTKAIQDFRDGNSYVYFIGADEGLIKIGVSNAPLERITAMQTGCPVLLRFMALVIGDAKLERRYHDRFATHRRRGEWFERCPEIEAEIERLNADAPEHSIHSSSGRG